MEPELKEAAEPKAPAPVVKTVVRNVRLEELDELVNLCVESALHQVKHGNVFFSDDPRVLKGGFLIEIGMLFKHPRAKMIVAQRGDHLVGFMMATLEDCGPTEKFLRCVYVKGDYLSPEVDNMRRPLILKTLWSEIYKWGCRMGADYFYGLIHPGNTPNIRAAKHTGFKHSMTQFFRLAEPGGSDNGRRSKQ